MKSTKNILLLFILSLFFGWSCTKYEVPKKEVPKCIRSKIRQFNNPRVSCENASVGKYRFQGEEVYLFYEGKCYYDKAAPVFDSHCQKIGSVGGLSGNTMVNGEDFKNAEFLETIWKF